MPRKTCPTCVGDGVVYEPRRVLGATTQQLKRHGELRYVPIDCPQCGGAGWLA